jgi:hypothetical protein
MTTKEKEGWVYCISNDNIRSSKLPNNVLLKIGMTNRTPQERLAEANKSDTWRPPVNYKIEFAKRVRNALKKEKTIHKLLEQYNERVNRSREFFDITVEKARLYFDLMDGEYWETPIKETDIETDIEADIESEETLLRTKEKEPSNIIIDNNSQFYFELMDDDEYWEPITKRADKKKDPSRIKDNSLKDNSLKNKKAVNQLEAIFNINVKDLKSEDSQKLLTVAFDKKCLDIKLKSKYHTFETIQKIQEKNIKNKLFTAIISCSSEPDIYITPKNINAIINQIQNKIDSTFILLTEI